jgi:CRP-like cAMP-binding protein
MTNAAVAPSRAELTECCPALAEGLSAADLDALLAAFEPRALADGEVLLAEGEASACAYLVWRGRFRVTVGAAAAGVTAGELGPGSWLGEVSLLDGDRASATATAAGPSVVLALPAEVLARLYGSEPRLGASLVRAMCVTLAGRIRRATDQLEAMRGGAAQAQLPRRGILDALRMLMGG